MRLIDSLVQRASVLDAAACAQIASTVRALRAHWIARDSAAFYTLGAALYLDAPTAETLRQFGRAAPPPEAYATNAARFNGLLTEHFPVLYATLAAVLQQLLQAPVRYADERALPGFHIFEHAPIYAEQRGHVPHFDRQYECIAWPADTRIDFKAAISITLPICLPRAGAGLRVWDLSLQQIQAESPARARELAASAPSHLYRYTPGELVCHRGHLLHQIMPWPSQPGDARITWQAHGLYYHDAWQLYW